MILCIHALDITTTVVGHKVHVVADQTMSCTTTRVYGSSSLNVAAWAIVAPSHTSTFVTTLLGEYFFDLDVLGFYAY